MDLIDAPHLVEEALTATYIQRVRLWQEIWIFRVRSLDSCKRRWIRGTGAPAHGGGASRRDIVNEDSIDEKRLGDFGQAPTRSLLRSSLFGR